MDGFLYPASLILIVLLAFTFYRNNNTILMGLVLVIGVYIVFSHETGHTATEFRNDVIDSLDQSARDFSATHGAEGYDADKAKKAVK
ncbi:hypothetical protein SAMN06314019_1017 [Epsilonproteobacteria bacterium SCGC AD-311-C15]|jgi:hypothetical protein|nr:hypothetical protein SAMN06314019_1017 [Epsilonproteobacteria bacterium SCGC AD-311-C15]